jgi:tetratricopeptide (TPR) repeat protein
MFFAFSNLFAQEKNTELDSLKQILSKQIEDTNKLNTLNIIIIVAPDGIWENYNKQFKLLAQKLEQNKNPQIKKVAKKCYAAAINNDGYYWENNQGNLEKALLCYQQSLKIRQELKDQLEVAQSYNNIASLYQKAGNISKSIEFFKLSLSIREKLKDKTDIANSLLNLGPCLKVAPLSK